MKQVYVPPHSVDLEPTIALSVSTYKKPEALKGWLESVLANFGPVKAVNISDDNDGECEEIAHQYSSLFEEKGIKLAYSTGPNKGVAVNKNRGIKFFIEDPTAQDCNYLVLSDDDIAFTRNKLTPMQHTIRGVFNFGEETLSEQLISVHKASKSHHITGYLGNYRDPLSGNPFFEQFPPVMETEYLYFCQGSQGILLSFTKEAILQTGFLDVFPTRYGYEHVLYTARINRIFGMEPSLFPILKNCHRYFGCQNIANNYQVVPAELDKNAKFYRKRLDEVYTGVNLVINNSGV